MIGANGVALRMELFIVEGMAIGQANAVGYIGVVRSEGRFSRHGGRRAVLPMDLLKCLVAVEVQVQALLLLGLLLAPA